MWTANRRTFITGCAGLALGTTFPAAGAADDSLDALAARSGRFFGAALSSGVIQDVPSYKDILASDCSVWVPDWELKWGALMRRLGDRPYYDRVDTLIQEAQRLGKRLRGHTLLWHEHLPDGVADLTTPADWDRFVVPHIRSVTERYRDVFFHWDVVNEAIEPNDDNSDRMRLTPFYRMLGPDYVGEAFRIAHEAAPAAKLYLNDYGLCYAEPWHQERRIGVLRLLERLIKQGVPVHGFGIQGHLDTRQSYDAQSFRQFIGALEALGIEITITELDVREADDKGEQALAARRQRAADEVEKVLAVALESKAVKGFVTWALSDLDSWLRGYPEISDNQGLPYDDELKPTPMHARLAALFKSAGT